MHSTDSYETVFTILIHFDLRVYLVELDSLFFSFLLFVFLVLIFDSEYSLPRCRIFIRYTIRLGDSFSYPVNCIPFCWIVNSNELCNNLKASKRIRNIIYEEKNVVIFLLLMDLIFCATEKSRNLKVDEKKSIKHLLRNDKRDAFALSIPFHFIIFAFSNIHCHAFEIVIFSLINSHCSIHLEKCPCSCICIIFFYWTFCLQFGHYYSSESPNQTQVQCTPRIVYLNSKYQK